jgi:hypothetical protein
MSEWSHSFTHKECGPRFLPLLHTSYTVDCPAALIGEDVSQGIMSSKKANNGPELSPIKGQKPTLAPRQGPEISS